MKLNTFPIALLVQRPAGSTKDFETYGPLQYFLSVPSFTGDARPLTLLACAIRRARAIRSDVCRNARNSVLMTKRKQNNFVFTLASLRKRTYGSRS